jgi:hypothetical protein
LALASSRRLRVRPAPVRAGVVGAVDDEAAVDQWVQHGARLGWKGRGREGPPARHRRPSGAGSPGRTRTCNLVVTRPPAFPRGLDYLIPVGGFRPPVGGGRFPRRRAAGVRPCGLVSARSLAPEREGFAQGSRVPRMGEVGFPEFARFSIPPFGRDAAFRQPLALPVELPGNAAIVPYPRAKTHAVRNVTSGGRPPRPCTDESRSLQ